MISKSNIYLSKTHIYASWFYTIIGSIGTFGLGSIIVMGLIIRTFIYGNPKGVAGGVEPTIVLFFIWILSFALFLSGLRGLWKAKQAKRTEGNIIQNVSIPNIYSSKLHLFTSWLLAITGGIGTLFVLLFMLMVFGAPFSIYGGGSPSCSSQFCSFELSIFLPPIIALILGIRGLWKAKQAKKIENNSIQNNQQ